MKRVKGSHELFTIILLTFDPCKVEQGSRFLHD